MAQQSEDKKSSQDVYKEKIKDVLKSSLREQKKEGDFKSEDAQHAHNMEVESYNQQVQQKVDALTLVLQEYSVTPVKSIGQERLDSLTKNDPTQSVKKSQVYSIKKATAPAATAESIPKRIDLPSYIRQEHLISWVEKILRKDLKENEKLAILEGFFKNPAVLERLIYNIGADNYSISKAASKIEGGRFLTRLFMNNGASMESSHAEKIRTPLKLKSAIYKYLDDPSLTENKKLEAPSSELKKETLTSLDDKLLQKEWKSLQKFWDTESKTSINDAKEKKAKFVNLFAPVPAEIDPNGIYLTHDNAGVVRVKTTTKDDQGRINGQVSTITNSKDIEFLANTTYGFSRISKLNKEQVPTLETVLPHTITLSKKDQVLTAYWVEDGNLKNKVISGDQYGEVTPDESSTNMHLIAKIVKECNCIPKNKTKQITQKENEKLFSQVVIVSQKSENIFSKYGAMALPLDYSYQLGSVNMVFQKELPNWVTEKELLKYVVLHPDRAVANLSVFPDNFKKLGDPETLPMRIYAQLTEWNAPQLEHRHNKIEKVAEIIKSFPDSSKAKISLLDQIIMDPQVATTCDADKLGDRNTLLERLYSRMNEWGIERPLERVNEIRGVINEKNQEKQETPDLPEFTHQSAEKILAKKILQDEITTTEAKIMAIDASINRLSANPISTATANPIKIFFQNLANKVLQAFKGTTSSPAKTSGAPGSPNKSSTPHLNSTAGISGQLHMTPVTKVTPLPMEQKETADKEVSAWVGRVGKGINEDLTALREQKNGNSSSNKSYEELENMEATLSRRTTYLSTLLAEHNEKPENFPAANKVLQNIESAMELIKELKKTALVEVELTPTRSFRH